MTSSYRFEIDIGKILDIGKYRTSIGSIRNLVSVEQSAHGEAAVVQF